MICAFWTSVKFLSSLLNRSAKVCGSMKPTADRQGDQANSKDRLFFFLRILNDINLVKVPHGSARSINLLADFLVCSPTIVVSTQKQH